MSKSLEHKSLAISEIEEARDLLENEKIITAFEKLQEAQRAIVEVLLINKEAEKNVV